MLLSQMLGVDEPPVPLVLLMVPVLVLSLPVVLVAVAVSPPVPPVGSPVPDEHAVTSASANVPPAV
jgi:hypothetical protein